MRNSAKMRRQRGQTLILVAVSLVALVAVAALAIDLTTLYVARTETQRAADAAALAGAEAFVDSGTTTDPTNVNLQTLAGTMANAFISNLLTQNTVGGATPVLVGGPTIDFTTHPGNPQITVTLQRTDVPTFFARIFGQRLATVTATSVAEAYNSSNTTGATGTMPAVAPSCIKPWLVINIDPNDHGSGVNKPFVNPDGSLGSPPGTGAWTGTTGGVVGEPLSLPNQWIPILPALLSLPGYLPAHVGAPSGSCSACAGGGGNFAESVACCDTANASQYQCGAGAPPLLVDIVGEITGTLQGAACVLTGAVNSSPTIGDDVLDPANFQSSNGTQPLQITAGTGPHSGQQVTTSGQIVTLPIVDTNLLGLQAKVIGYMQAFISGTGAGGSLNLYVLNISGCGTNINPGAPPVSGGGVSPVPVRLIHN